MARPVRMPPLGTTSDELRIVEWLKQEGEQVALGEPLLAVETDKATLEVEAAASGTLLRIVRGAGSVVEAGALVGYVGEPGEELPDDDPAPEPPGPVLASPAVRRLAEERGVDLAGIPGSGPGGRIEKGDVLALAGSGDADGEPLSAHRAALARRLARSAAVPQFSLGVTVDMTGASALLERLRADVPGLTHTHLLLRATAATLRSHPSLNALWLDDGPRRRTLGRADVGLAVAGDDALLVVAIPEPDRQGLEELVHECERAAGEARAGRISERYSGPVAVTLSTLGATGIDRFTALVDPDQTAILAAGAVAERPGSRDGRLALVPQVDLTLTADHRVVDGLAAGRFLADLRTALEDADGPAGAP